MIDDCDAGNIDMIVTKSISRFARNTIDCLKYIRQLKDKNIPVIFEKENINTMDAKGEVLITIMASLAQQESESLSRNVKLGLQYRYQQGKVQVNHKWFLGYTKDDKGNLVIDPEQAETVRRIYREYLEGKSCQKIAKGLEADGVMNGAGKTKWWDSNIIQILRNEKYMGDALLQKTYTEDVLSKKRVENDGTVPQYYVENDHEAIIPRELFHEVQAEIARRSRKKNDNDQPVSYCSKFALTEVVFCGDCGEPFRRITYSYNGEKSFVWRCRGRLSKDAKPCLARTVKEDELHTVVLKSIRKAFGNQDGVMDQLNRNIEIAVGSSVTQDLVDCETRIKQLQTELIDRVNSGSDHDDLAIAIQNEKARKDELLAKQAAEGERKKHVQEMTDFFVSHRKESLRYSDSLVRKLIQRITVNKYNYVIEFKSGVTVEVK